MCRRYLQDRIYDEGSEIEFQVNGVERLGLIDEVNFSKNKFQKRVWYVVTCENGENYNVDGELFQVIN